MSVSSRRPPAQLNHLLTYITAPGPRPPPCVYSPNPFLQQMTGSPTEPVRRSRPRCITTRAHPIMRRGEAANLVAAQLSTQRQLRRHSADPAGGGGAGLGVLHHRVGGAYSEASAENGSRICKLIAEQTPESRSSQGFRFKQTEGRTEPCGSAGMDAAAD